MIYKDTESKYDDRYIFKKTLVCGDVLRLTLRMLVFHIQKPLGKKADNEQDCYGYVDFEVVPIGATLNHKWENGERLLYKVLEQEINQEITKYFLNSA